MKVGLQSKSVCFDLNTITLVYYLIDEQPEHQYLRPLRGLRTQRMFLLATLITTLKKYQDSQRVVNIIDTCGKNYVYIVADNRGKTLTEFKYIDNKVFIFFVNRKLRPVNQLFQSVKQL